MREYSFDGYPRKKEKYVSVKKTNGNPLALVRTSGIRLMFCSYLSKLIAVSAAEAMIEIPMTALRCPLRLLMAIPCVVAIYLPHK